jgi:hypothetical protein
MRAALLAAGLLACSGAPPAAKVPASTAVPAAPWYCRSFDTVTDNGDESFHLYVTTCDRTLDACAGRMVFRFRATAGDSCKPAAAAQCFHVLGFGAGAVQCFASERDCETQQNVLAGAREGDCTPAE